MTDQEKKDREDLRAYRREKLKRLEQKVITDRLRRMANNRRDKLANV